MLSIQYSAFDYPGWFVLLTWVALWIRESLQLFWLLQATNSSACLSIPARCFPLSSSSYSLWHGTLRIFAHWPLETGKAHAVTIATKPLGRHCWLPSQGQPPLPCLPGWQKCLPQQRQKIPSTCILSLSCDLNSGLWCKGKSAGNFWERRRESKVYSPHLPSPSFLFLMWLCESVMLGAQETILWQWG